MMTSNLEVYVPVGSKGDTVRTSSHEHVQTNPHLHIPPPSPLTRRRSSHASIFSDLSDLDYMSNNHDQSLLRRTVSNVSNFSTSSDLGPVNFRRTLKSLYHQNYGVLLVLLSQVFGSFMNISARLLEQPGAHGAPMHPFQILFTRQALTALACTGYALWTKSIPEFPLGPRGVRWLLVSRGVCGFFGVFGMYFSLQYLPLSEATVLTFLAPILTCYICSLLLPNETFTRQQQIAGFVSFVGVVFIAQPVTLFSSFSASASSAVDGGVSPTNATTPTTPTSGSLADRDPTNPTPQQHLLAIGIAMLGVLGATGAMTSIRAIGTRAHAFISINYFSVLSTVVCIIALIVVPGVSFRLPGNLLEWALLLNLGVCGFVLQGLLTMGLAYGGPASKPDHSPASASTQAEHLSRQTTGNKASDEDIEMQVHSDATTTTTPPSSSSHHNQSTRHHHHHRAHKPKPHPSGNRATSMVYCQMLFALIADKIIFGTTLGAWSWIGSGLILSGAVWVATAKDGKPPPSVIHRVVDTDRPFRTDHDTSKAPEEQVGLLRDDPDDTDADDDEQEQSQRRPEPQPPPNVQTPSSPGFSAPSSSSASSR